MFDLKVMKGLRGLQHRRGTPRAQCSALPIMTTKNGGWASCIGDVVKLCGLGLMSSANFGRERALCWTGVKS